MTDRPDEHDDSESGPEISQELLGQLLQAAEQVRENAYAPFSKFRVGAAILTSSGNIYAGANVENSSYGLTICAERSAICSAVSDGEVDPHTAPIIAVAIVAEPGDEGVVAPCGACRQVINEFGPDALIYLAQPGASEVHQLSMRDLLPMSFRLTSEQ